MCSRRSLSLSHLVTVFRFPGSFFHDEAPARFLVIVRSSARSSASSRSCCPAIADRIGWRTVLHIMAALIAVY